MNSYYNKKEFNEWVMLYLLDAITNSNDINEELEPEWAKFIDFLKARDSESFIRQVTPRITIRMKTYAKAPIKAVKDASENIRIMT